MMMDWSATFVYIIKLEKLSLIEIGPTMSGRLHVLYSAAVLGRVKPHSSLCWCAADDVTKNVSISQSWAVAHDLNALLFYN